MFINNPRDDRAFEADLEFNEQREFLARFQDTHGFFLDWLIAIYWELQGKNSPFEYAARVCIAEKILENTNLEHLMASQRTLLRVVRNLFPYDRISGEVPAGLRAILGECRGMLRKPRFRPLQDTVVKSEVLVQRRYTVLAKAFCGQAQNLLKILEEVVSEEEIPIRQNLAADALKEGKEELVELKRLRSEFFLVYPEEELTSVADSTIMKEAGLKRRSELPKDMEPEYMFKLIGKLETLVRGRLQSIMIEARHARDGILARKKVFINELNELLTMCATVKQYVESGSFDEINHASEDLIRQINTKFDLVRYLPADVLSDIEQGYALYKNGYL